MTNNTDTILNLLKENARIPTSELAKITGLSENKIDKILKKLEKDKIILQYKTIVNENESTSPKIKAIIELSIQPEHRSGYDKVANRISQHEHISDVYLVSGEYDYMIVIEGDSIHEISNFVSEIALLGNVTKTSTLFVLKTYKEYGVNFNTTFQKTRLSICP